MRSKLKRNGISADEVSLSTCEMEITSLLFTKVLSFLDHICPRAPFAKLVQSVSESSMAVLTARQWKQLTRWSDTASLPTTSEREAETRFEGGIFLTENEPSPFTHLPSWTVLPGFSTRSGSVRRAV